MEAQSQKSFISSISTIILAILIASIFCVASIPLFPSERNSNVFFRVCGILLYIISIQFLGNETNTFNTIFTRIRRICTREQDRYESIGNISHQQNFLAYVFFYGFIATQLWEIANQIHFYGDCFSTLALLEWVNRSCLGLFILVAMCQKIIRNQGIVQLQQSYMGWSILASVCFGCAFRGVVEEVIQAYIDIVEKSIELDEYGLHISSNITRAEDYVPLILKRRAHCLHDTICPWFMENVLENIPFTTEYFSLATFFCVLQWKHLRSQSENLHQEDHISQGIEPEADEVLEINSENVLEDEFRANTWFSFNFGPGFVIFCLILIAFTISSFVCFKNQMALHNHSTGIAIFLCQQLVFQLILLISEAIFFYSVLRRNTGATTAISLSSQHELDIMLLIFPLLPLGILLTLRVLPDIFSLWNNIGNPNHLSILLNFSLAALLFFQVAFQVLFIAQILYQLDERVREFRIYRSFFWILTLLNLCVWFSWTVECKLITIHGQSIQIYGAVEWIIVVYSTVPFVLFCFAHTTSCFFEIVRHLGHHASDSRSHQSIPLNMAIN